jgi:hypothetical protein
MSGSYQSEFINDTTLDAQSALVWTGNADAFKQGAVTFRVRTAPTSDQLATTTWRMIKRSGDLIAPTTGDVWLQVRVDMQRSIPKQPNSEKNVWLGESSVVYNRLPLQAGAGIPSVNQAEVFTKPTVTSYRVIKINSDLANFSLNGKDLFRFSAGGGAYTADGGSWNSGGADVAEYFPTNDDTLNAGDLVTISQDAQDGLIAKTTRSYDDNLLGIITTTPGVKLGSDVVGGNAQKQPVALVGRVPLNISLENGRIKKGDYLTSSSRPGIAMRATDPGRVVAIALEDSLESNLNENGTGKLLVYVNPHTYLGVTFWDRTESKFSRWGYVVKRALLEFGISILDNGNVGIGTDNPVTKLQVAGDLRIGTKENPGCIQDFNGRPIAGTCVVDELFANELASSSPLVSSSTPIDLTNLLQINSLQTQINNIVASSTSWLANLKDIFFGTLSADHVITIDLKADIIEARRKSVSSGIEFIDSLTNEFYCLSIASGEWQKLKGECISGSVTPILPESSPSSTDAIIESVVSTTSPVILLEEVASSIVAEIIATSTIIESIGIIASSTETIATTTNETLN